MSASATAAAAPAAAPAQEGTDWKWTVARSLVVFFGIQAITSKDGLLSKFTGSKSDVQAPVSDGAAFDSSSMGGQAPVAGRTGPTPPQKQPQRGGAPGWPQGGVLDFYLFLTSGPPATPEELASQFSTLVPHGSGVGSVPSLVDWDAESYAISVLDSSKRDPSRPIVAHQFKDTMQAVKWTDVDTGAKSFKRKLLLDVDIYPEIRISNHSMWAEIFVTRPGVSPSPKDPSYQQQWVFHSRKLLTRLYPAKKQVVEKRLFTSTSEDGKDKVSAETEKTVDLEKRKLDQPVTWWHPNLTLALVEQKPNQALALNQLAPPLAQWIHPIPSHPQNTATNIYTYPILFPNDFWLLREHMFAFNASTLSVPLSIEIYGTSFFKFQMLAAFSDSFDKQAMASSEIDMIKTTLIETPIWLLALTISVSLLHTLFEFLAFSQEVQFWRSKKDLTGVSVSSIVTNVFVQLVILLYLLDSREDTSWTILLGQGVGMVIEAWKLTRAMTVSIIGTPRGEKSLWRFSPIKLNIKDKHVLSEEEKKSQEFDKLAFKYVMLAMSPILGGYAIYSAIYNTHKGYWSYFIGTLTSFVYAFGFVSLVPSLILNYKLKSTAGMNTKTFIYKILGTFVDDLFAFCIKMPTLHRLACFRDDLVFAVFLYQRWIYPTDLTRVNEFGTVVEPVDGTGEPKQQQISDVKEQPLLEDKKNL